MRLLTFADMVASSLIASGICSAIQMTRFKIPFSERFFSIPRYMGTGKLLRPRRLRDLC